MRVNGLICVLAGTVALFGQEPVMLSFAGDAEPAYQAVLRRLKVDGEEIESASKDAGIHTKVVRKGGRVKQSATYMMLTFIPDGDHTQVRIAVYEQHRVNIPLVSQAWSEPALSEDGSKAEAFTLKNELGW